MMDAGADGSTEPAVGPRTAAVVVLLVVLVAIVGLVVGNTSVRDPQAVALGSVGEVLEGITAGDGALVIQPHELDPTVAYQHAVVAWDLSDPRFDEAGAAAAQAALTARGGVLLDATTGLLLLRLTPPHIEGDTAPFCVTAQWFEEPQHGSKFNRMGEWTGGPAPRGLPTLPLRLVSGQVVVDTTDLRTGPDREDGVFRQQPEGPNCVDL